MKRHDGHVRQTRPYAEDSPMAKKTAKTKPKKPRRPAGKPSVAAAAGAVREGSAAGLGRKAGPRRTASRCPGCEKIVVNMGVGERDHREEASGRRQSPRWPRSPARKPLITKSRMADRQLSPARKHADRLQGDAPRHADVGIPRPADLAGAAPRARLPRPEPQRRSTATATTAWACRNNWCFRS